jgi:hypothetical protein
MKAVFQVSTGVTPMAADNASDPNLKAHRGTYSGFLSMTKWAIILITITLIVLFAFVFGE